MDKKELRELAKRQRREFKDKRSASAKIKETLLDLPEMKAAKTVALYCSLPGEVDTDLLIDELLKEGKEICVPLVRGKQMLFIRIRSREDLTAKGSFGIREPLFEETSVVLPEMIDLAVFPGLAFDREGRRLGYGGGYYDRAFAHASGVPKIAVCFSCQIFDQIPTEEYDLKVDKIVTENEIYAIKTL